ncbi:MAG: hypothetical protein HRU15_08980 [Planctomycetes bacterium]|nr:hypothetical protein [Planctomycetota bacterium]
MGVTPKQALLQRSAHYQPIAKASARAESMARPQDLLGADPDKQIQYQNNLTAGLQGPNAVRISADLSVPGQRVNTLA